jgi:hypothetical protein
LSATIVIRSLRPDDDRGPLRTLEVKRQTHAIWGEPAVIKIFQRRLENARRLRLLRRLIEEAPTATVRWDLLTIATRDGHAGRR